MRDAADIQARIALLSTRLQIKHSGNELSSQLQLEALDEEFTEKQCEYDSLLNCLAPISSLPNEVLAEVFILGYHSSSPKDRIPFEILVSHVNHHWREVALGTCTLWARIHRHVLQRDLEPIAVYLQRSKQSPIHLIIEINHWERGWKEDDISLFCRLIEPHLPRCSRLFMENSIQEFKILEQLASISMPILWSLRLSLTDCLEPLRILTGGASSLTHAHLDDAALLYCHPPLASVTTLHLHLVDWPKPQFEYEKMSVILSTMPNLAHLELNATGWPSQVPMNLSMIHTIKYRLWNGDCASGLLIALHAPSLQNMTIHFASLVRTEFDERVALTGASNFPALRRLHVTSDKGEVSLANIRKLSRAFPYLVEITFRMLDFTNAHISQMLALSEDSQSLRGGVGVWPRLRTLGISHMSDGEQLPTLDLHVFLARRAAMGFPLRTLLLPPTHVAKGRELFSRIEPPVTIADCPWPHTYETWVRDSISLARSLAESDLSEYLLQ